MELNTTPPSGINELRYHILQSLWWSHDWVSPYTKQTYTAGGTNVGRFYPQVMAQLLVPEERRYSVHDTRHP